jgi:hypothetical protein
LIWLTSQELLDSTRRSLLENVVPAIDDDFARVQAIAATQVLAEVGARLVEGDPVMLDTRAVEDVLHRWGLPSAESSEAGGRAYNTVARELAYQAIHDADETSRDQLAAEFASVESAVAKRDLTWVCREAIATLE